jgi:hypothetical protein
LSTETGTTEHEAPTFRRLAEIVWSSRNHQLK